MGNDVLFAWTDISRETTADMAGNAPLGAGQGTRDFWFQHFQVLMWDNLTGSGEIIRTEYVTSNMFRYTKEMNAEDHGGTPDRQFGISVKAVDIFNKKSPQHMAINVINYAPAEVINYHDALTPVTTHWLWVLEFVAYSDGRFSVAWPEGTALDRDGFVIHRQVNAADPTVFPKTAFIDEFGNTRYEPDDADGVGNVLLWVKGQNTWFHDVIPLLTSTLSFTIGAKDVFGDTGLRYSMHFVVDKDFDGTRDPVTGLWTGVTAYKW